MILFIELKCATSSIYKTVKVNTSKHKTLLSDYSPQGTLDNASATTLGLPFRC